MPFDMPGNGVGMINLSEMMSKISGGAAQEAPQAQGAATPSPSWPRRKPTSASIPDDVTRVALADAEANGIVFLDEIDKIAVIDVRGGSVSREGVQRDLLPLIEGTTVATKYGPIKTDHILFIASRARSTSPSPPTCCPSSRAGCRSGSSWRR